MAKPTLNQVLLTLKSQIIVGKTCLSIAEGLLRCQQYDPAIIQATPVFFGFAINGNLEHAQMTVARLYDTTSGSVTIPRMLAQAKQETKSFVRGDQEQIGRAIERGEQTVIALEPI